MFRISVQLLLAVSVVHSSRFYTYPLLSLSNTPVVECTDNVCKVVPSSSSIKAEVVNLESKILKEWKAAGNTEHSSAAEHSTSAAVEPVVTAVEVSTPLAEVSEQTAEPAAAPVSEQSEPLESAAAKPSDEPSDLESKVTELKKMGFAAADAKSALKRSKYEVSDAAALLEAEEEEKEEVQAKVSEIGEEQSLN